MYINEQFISPSQDYRGTDFWMLNGQLDEQELRRQLQEMRKQGITSVIVRTYNGLKSDYPGPDFKGKMHIVVDEARSLNMTLFMQPCYMPGCNLKLPEVFSLGEIKACPEGQGEGVILDTYDHTDYCLVSSRCIVDMMDPEAMDYYIKQSYEDMWKDFKEDFGKTIISMWVDEPRYDTITLPWTKKLPDTFKEVWGYDFPMDKIHLLFKDGSGDIVIRLQYWRTVLFLIKNNYFKKVREWCHSNGLLFSGHLMSEDKMESQIRATCFTMPLYKYFDIPGIDYLTTQMNWRYSPVKPIEQEFKRVWQYADYITPIQCSSAAHQAGKEKILCEMYGVTTENLSLRDQKYMFDCFAALGINYRSIHAIFYTLQGFTKRVYPVHIGDYQPYWPKYHLLTDAIARESWFIRQGKPKSDILVIHPMDSAFCEYKAKGIRGEQNNYSLNRRDRAFLEMTANLVSMQISFEFGDEETIGEEGYISTGGHFVIGNMQYSAVILPDMMTIRKSTVNLLNKFMDAGGIVYALYRLPELIDGEPAEESCFSRMTLVNNLSSFPDIFDTTKKRSFYYQSLDNCSHIRIQCREDNGKKYFFIFNDSCSDMHEGYLSVEGTYEALQYHPEDGKIENFPCEYKEGKTFIPVSIPEGGSMLLELIPGKNKIEYQNKKHVRILLKKLKQKWKLKRNEPNALVFEMYRFAREGELLSKKTYPILVIQEILSNENYHGKILLSCSLETRIKISGAKLALETPGQQELYFDGKIIPSKTNGFYLARAFETIDLPEISPGKHEIRIQRYFEPIRKAKLTLAELFEDPGGVNLEAIMLIGDFAVKAGIERSIGYEAGNCIRLNPNFIIDKEPCLVGREITHAGYPFYAGSIMLENEFIVEGAKVGGKVYFELEGINACACEVYINGKKAGDINWKPYRVELTGKLIEGINKIELKIYNSLRNLIGPWHRPSGEIGWCAPKSWLNNEKDNAGAEEWYEDRIPDRNGWTESYLILPFGVDDARIIFEE